MEPNDEAAQVIVQQYQQWLADAQLQNAQLIARVKFLEKKLDESAGGKI